MLDQAFDAAERGRALPEFHARCGRDRGAFAAADADRQHRAEAAHLPRRDGVTGMRGQAGIEHARDPRMRGELVREQRRALRLRAHAHIERAQSPQQEPRLERPEDRAVLDAVGLDALPGVIVRAVASTPAITSEWPFRYFEAECITRSAPSASGL